MPAPLSVIIPTLNAEATLPATLHALVEALQGDLIREVIIADGGSADATLSIADAWGARIVRCDAGRGRQLGAGAAAAKGAWLLFLHADTCLSAGWSHAAAAHIAAKNTTLAGYGRLRFDTRGGLGGISARFVAGWANLRSKLFALPYGDQALLISRDFYDAVGGYPPISLMEDVAIARAIGRKKTQLGFDAITRGDAFVRDGWFRRGAANLWTLALYFMGRDTEDLAERYRVSDE